MQKQTDPILRAANVVTNNMGTTAFEYRNKSPYDKSFSAVILGVNQKFIDDISNTEKKEIIGKHNIPEEIQDINGNYYTVKINGAYYVKRSISVFSLYENVIVRVPNGSWANMFIEANKSGESGDEVELPTLYILAAPPSGTEEQPLKEGDYWIEVDNIVSKTIEAFYIYKKSNDTYTWEKQCNILGRERSIFFSSTRPSLADTKAGDIWVKVLSSDSTLSEIYEYANMSWTLKAKVSTSTGGVGENVGNYNERFNDYSGNTITNGYYNSVRGQNNTITSLSDNPQYMCCDTSGWYNTQTRTDYDETTDYIDITYTDAYKIAYRKRGETWPTQNYFTGNQCSGQQNALTDTKTSLISGFVNHAVCCENVFMAGAGNYLENAKNCLIIGTASRGGMPDEAIQRSAIIGDEIDVSGFDDSLFVGYGHRYNLSSEGLTNAHSGIIVGGEFAKINSENTSSGTMRTLLAIGNGTKRHRTDAWLITFNNALSLNTSGDLEIQGTLYQGGADYAETYEWLDGNMNNEDRRGLFVTLDGDKIIKADEHSDYILGVVSATPTVCGDTYEQDWKGKFKRDIFGAILYNEDGNMIISEEYDPEREYIPQSKRPEKSFVGTHGKLVVVDDGTCKVNGYCKPSKGGVATASREKTDYRVIERKDATHIRIVIK